jgi:8-oxo-dGTP pyrophosphatase MutT (NUDIX family)
MTLRLRRFLETAQHQNNPFARELIGKAPEIGHVTGSAWIVNQEYSRVVLLYHAKLQKWVQPGGHCDGESNALAVAHREAEEETGLAVTPLSTLVFDVDVHEIPEYWNTPAHLHFDVRYLFQADENQVPVCSEESKAVRWMSLDEASTLSGEESVRRMIEKTRRLRT